MKGIVLAGGRGSRINDVTQGCNKCLLKVKDKSLIRYNVEHLVSLEKVTECIVVVGYYAESVMREIRNVCNQKKITYCIQTEQKGLIHALESAKYALDSDDFIMVLGDEFVLDNTYKAAVSKFYQLDTACMIGSIEAEDIELVKRTYSFRMDKESGMTDFVEKLTNPFNCFMGTGNMIAKGKVMQLLEEIPVNPERGERELAGLFNLLLERKYNISSFTVGTHYVNVNTAIDLEMLEQIIK